MELRTWDDVDGALRLMGELQNQVEVLQAQMDEEIARIRETYDRKIQPLLQEIHRLEQSITDFALKHRAQIRGKSRRLNFGIIQFRKRPDAYVFTRPREAIIQTLEAWGYTFAIRVKKDVDRKALSRIPEDKLIQAGIVKRPGEERITVKVNREAIVNAEAES